MGITERDPKILFVDDEQEIGAVYGEILKRFGYNVVTESSSVKALELFRQGPGSYDLVIADFDMPEMNGDDLLMELTDIRPDIPTILITGYFQDIGEERAEALGIKAFLTKPLKPQLLADTIREILAKTTRDNHLCVNDPG